MDSSVKKVQHPTGGVVGELRVREGDRVKAGDILVRLDETQTLANATIITRASTNCSRARLVSRPNGIVQSRLTFPKVLLERAERQPPRRAARFLPNEACSILRGQARSGQKAQLKERSAQLQDEIKGYTGQAEAKQKEVDFIHAGAGGSSRASGKRTSCR